MYFYDSLPTRQKLPLWDCGLGQNGVSLLHVKGTVKSKGNKY